MPRYSLQKLPKQFQYFFSLKEIKAIELRVASKFDLISTGAITQSGHFNKDQYIQSGFRALSIAAHKVETTWKFSIHQGGFRSILFPESLQHEVKQMVVDNIIFYIDKVKHSRSTDGLIARQLWVYVMIIENRPKVSFNEIK